MNADTVLSLDGPDGAHVVAETYEEYVVQPLRTGVRQDFPQGPRCDALSSGRWAYAVADVAQVR